MDDLYGSIEETTLNDDLLDEEGLRQWFKKGGWRQAGGKYDGKPCARQPGQKTTPKCVSRKKYSSMSKKERESAGRRKRKKDPNQTKKSGAAKPTYVKTDPQKGGRKKKSKSKKNEELYMDLEQLIQEELEKIINEGIGTGALIGGALMAAAMSGDDSSPKEVVKDTMSNEEKKRIAAELVKKIQQDQGFQELARQWEEADNLKRNKPATNLGFDRSAMKPARGIEEIVKEELEALLDEKRKKKQQKGKKRAAKKAKRKKKSGKKDACYHKVKSRYKVWPSAYASGALVKCRRVGAKNWGNSKKESVEIDVQNAILEILNESHTKEDEETLKKMAKKLRGSSKLHADQAEELQDIIDRSPNDELDESHSEKDEETLEDIAGQLRKASKMHAGQAEKIEKIVDDSDDSELREEEEQITESPNCGCGNDPCDSYGKNGEKLVIMVKEEIEAVMKELQLSEQEMNPNTLEAKRLVDELGADVLLQLDNKDDGSFDDAIENAIKDYANFEKVRDEILTMIGAEVEVRGTSGADIHRQIKGGLEEKKKKKKKKSAKDRMKCNSSRRIRKGEPGYGKKKFVVKACEGGTEKIIRYGDANMEIKKDSPKRRKSFRARHNCKNPGSKLKARYWSCKKW